MLEKTIKQIAPMATAYESYRYLWPPRPEQKTPPDNLKAFDNKQFIAQPKMDGDNTTIYMNDAGLVKCMNRHDEEKSGNINIDFANLYRGKNWFVLNGEWMNTSKLDETGNKFNKQFVIFDVLVYDGYLLTGSTVANRVQLLQNLYGSDTMSVNENGNLRGHSFLYNTNLSNVYRVISYEDHFEELFKAIIKIDMMEGLVLKHKNGMLKYPGNETANQSWQLKCRKPKANYKF
jgi:ATP-dependent DNA ligase